MFELRNTKKERVTLTVRTEVLEDFQGFVEWARQFQEHADEETVVEHIMTEALGSRLAEMRAFREWQRSKEVPTETGSLEESTEGQSSEPVESAPNEPGPTESITERARARLQARKAT